MEIKRLKYLQQTKHFTVGIELEMELFLIM